jgi:hypothetical protein
MDKKPGHFVPGSDPLRNTGATEEMTNEPAAGKIKV